MNILPLLVGVWNFLKKRYGNGAESLDFNHKLPTTPLPPVLIVQKKKQL